MRGAALRTKCRRHNAASAASGVAGGAVALVFLVAAPLASAATLGVSITRPYAGNQVAYSSKRDPGRRCAGTGSYSYTAPWFTPSRGRGSTGGQSTSQDCGAWVDEFDQLDATFGYSQNITTSTSLAHDEVRFHWTLTYSMYLSSSGAGANDTACSYGAVFLTAFVYDRSAGGSVGSTSLHYNSSYVLDSSSSVYFTVYRAHPVMLVHLNVVAGHVYEFESHVTAETQA